MRESVRLSARSLAIGYDAATPIARELDLDLRAGEFVCLLGPNGAGKSTLLRTLAGLQAPLAGRIELDGRSLDAWRPRQLARRLAVVLTDRAQPGLMTGLDLVRLGRHPHTPWTGALSDADRAAVQAALDAVGARDLAPRLLTQLSDGERQKVTIARALAQEAEVLVLDEVTAFLDLPRRVEIVRLLRSLAHDAGKAVVLATHDLDLALRSADQLWLLARPVEKGPARLSQGLPESLVLNGSFEQVFAAEGVDFDRRSGSFEVRRRPRGEAWVEGEGLAAIWTRRALDRLGFRLEPSARVRLRVAEDPGRSGAVWLVDVPSPDGSLRSSHTSLDAALGALEVRPGSGDRMPTHRPIASEPNPARRPPP